MAEQKRDENRTAAATAAPRRHRDEPMDEEEKILANRPDVNMPALLTRDVPGG
jgi:hypothetical protein